MRASKYATVNLALLVTLAAAATVACGESDDGTGGTTAGAGSGTATGNPSGGGTGTQTGATDMGTQTGGTSTGTASTTTGGGGTAMPTGTTTGMPTVTDDSGGGTGSMGGTDDSTMTDDSSVADDSAMPDDSSVADDSTMPDDSTMTDDGMTDDSGPDDGPPPMLPSLVVSSSGSYWNEGEAMVVESGTANFTVNSGMEEQEWHGWGGTFNEAGWDALQELSEADRQMAMTLLFDEESGIGMDWGRIPIGPSDYALERYTLSDGPASFTVTRDQQYLIPFIKAAQAIKNDVIYWASPWTPPPWMKTGETESSGYDKGIFNTANYQDYADFFVSWIQAYEAEGIPIDSVMPQNEPGWAQSYPTCAFGPATDSTYSTELPSPVTLGTFVDEYLFPSIDAAGLSTKVWYGTLSNNKYFPDYWNDMMSKPSADRIVGGGLQWETQASINTVLSAGKLAMQSEHRCGNYPWLGAEYGGTDATSRDDATRSNFLPGMAPNNHAYGEESWEFIRDWIGDGVHIYSAWNMVLDSEGFNLDDVRPWPQNAMLSVNRNAGTLEVTPYYYVFRHVAQFVDIGATRVGINGDALAFKHDDGRVVAVMRTTSPGTQIVSIDGTLIQFESGGNGWVTVNYTP